MIGGTIGYLLTKLGGYNGKDPKNQRWDQQWPCFRCVAVNKRNFSKSLPDSFFTNKNPNILKNYAFLNSNIG